MARPRGRPASGTELRAGRVIKAARDLLGEHGLAGLTMRALALRLGVDASSLYWHVRNKEALFDLIADDIIGEVRFPPTHLPWRDQLAAIAVDYRRVLTGTRDAAKIMAGRWPSGENTWRALDRLLAPLLAAGFAPDLAAHAGYLLHGYVTGYVLQELSPMNAAEARGTPAHQVLADTHHRLSTLPADEYPALRAAAAALTAPTTEERFHLGLDLTLDGLAFRAHPRGSA